MVGWEEDTDELRGGATPPPFSIFSSIFFYSNPLFLTPITQLILQVLSFSHLCNPGVGRTRSPIFHYLSSPCPFSCLFHNSCAPKPVFLASLIRKLLRWSSSGLRRVSTEPFLVPIRLKSLSSRCLSSNWELFVCLSLIFTWRTQSSTPREDLSASPL